MVEEELSDWTGRGIGLLRHVALPLCG
jgi:hypothetical protein